MKLKLCTIFFFTSFSFKNTIAQQWPLTLRSGLVSLIIKGTTTRHDTYSPPSYRKNGTLGFAFFYPDTMIRKPDVYTLKDNIVKFVRSFALKDSMEWYQRIDIGFFSIRDSISPLKMWWEFNPPDGKDTIDTQQKRFDAFIHILPFETEAVINDDSVIVTMQDWPHITPYVDNLMQYFNVVASIFHYYVLNGNKRFIYLIHFHDGIATTYEYPKDVNFKKVFPLPKKFLMKVPK